MENASKALLISAVILIVIILIAFGIKIVSSSSGTNKEAKETADTMNNAAKSYEAALFNQPFLQYCGKDIYNHKTINKSELNSLFELINQYNSNLYKQKMLNGSNIITVASYNKIAVYDYNKVYLDDGTKYYKNLKINNIYDNENQQFETWCTTNSCGYHENGYIWTIRIKPL